MKEVDKAAMEAALEQDVLDLHFGCSDLGCVFADPPNKVGTNNQCTCITKTGFGQAVRRVHVRNQQALAALKANTAEVGE